MYHFRFTPDTPVQFVQNNIMDLIKVSNRPTIPLAEEIVESSTLGDGTSSYRHTGVYSDREIELTCNFVSTKREDYLNIYSEVQKYFNGNKGILELTSDDPNHFWKVKNVEFNISSRGRIGSEFTINFICEPYRYLNVYARPYHIITGEKVEFANFYEIAYPTYRIYNTSTNAELITIKSNGSYFTIKNPFTPYQITDEETLQVEYLELNSEQSYLKTYYENDVASYQTLKTSGSFDKLKFEYGSNSVEITVDIGALNIEVLRNYREK